MKSPGAQFQEAVDELLSASNSRRRATVGKFVTLLNELKNRGVTNYTIAVVGREAELKKIVTTQYIRNASGEPFRRLIQAFADQHNSSAGNSATSRLSPLEQAIAAIPDLDIRTRLLAMIDDNKALQTQVKRLEAGFKHLSAPSAQPRGGPEPATEPAVEVLPPPAKPSASLGPLERFISEEWLDQNAWTVSEAGTIMDGPHRITPPGFVPALTAAIGILRKR